MSTTTERIVGPNQEEMCAKCGGFMDVGTAAVDVSDTTGMPWATTTDWATVHAGCATPRAIPALFEVDPTTNEATGIVHPFCSEACRDASDPTPDLVKGTTDPGDFGFVPKCESCGKYIEGS